MKEDLPFMEHPHDRFTDIRVQAMCASFGLQGYARYWVLLELMAASPEARLDLSKRVARGGVAARLQLSMAEMEEFLDFLVDKEACGLVCMEGGIYFTLELDKSYAQVRAGREYARDQKKKVPRKV